MNPTNNLPASKWNTDRMRGPAWFRAILAGVTCMGAAAAFIYGAVLNSHGCMDRMGAAVMNYIYGVPLLIIGLPSIVTAVRLFRKSVCGIKVALTFDTIVVSIVTVTTVLCLDEFYDPRNQLGERIFFGLLPAAIALPFCVEAAWLLSACRGWRRAWWGVGVIALVLLIGPLAAHWLRAR